MHPVGDFIPGSGEIDRADPHSMAGEREFLKKIDFDGWVYQEPFNGLLWLGHGKVPDVGHQLVQVGGPDLRLLAPEAGLKGVLVELAFHDNRSVFHPENSVRIHLGKKTDRRRAIPVDLLL